MRGEFVQHFSCVSKWKLYHGFVTDHSNYHIDCVCGERLTSPDAETQCPHCGRLIRVEWPAKEEEE